jgi:23S rRNA pseudouridine2605 synthase
VAEGLAVPLNLLGTSGPGLAGGVGETPDFVASTAVFSYVFTLRGDKAWKQPPATAGALKVSQLALAVFEALTRRGPLSAYDLTTEVGKEVTEAAVLRALGELWTHLRVLPLAMPDGRATVWELAGARFTKQIKAGANAGQPSALSALISLYLGQVVVASEDEVESFLSPLAARSRIRDVIHALLSARQLNTLAVEGRTMLHVAGELPAFLAPAIEVPATAEAQGEVATGIEVATVTGEADTNGEAAPRITKYVPKPRKIGTGYLAKASPAKFAGKPFARAKPDEGRFGAKAGFKAGGKAGFKSGPKAGFKPRSGFGETAPDRERRPFSKPASGGAKRGFDKPWDEEKARRLAAAAKPSDVGDTPPADLAASAGPGKAPRKSFSKPGTFARKREGFAARPSFGNDRPPRRDFAPQGEDGGRPPRRHFAPRSDGGGRPAGRAARGERPAFGGPRTPGTYTPRPAARFDRAPRGEGRGESGGFAPRKPYPPRGAGFFSGKPRPSDTGSDQAARPDRSASGPRDRADRGPGTESGKRVYRKFDAPRDRPARPFSGRPARSEDSGDAGKPSGGFAPRKFAGKPSGRPGASAGRPGGKPGGSYSGKSAGFAGKKPFGKADGGFAGKKSFGKSDGSFSRKPGAKSTSTFAKFAGGKKPFGKRPPARKFKAKGDASA